MSKPDEKYKQSNLTRRHFLTLSTVTSLLGLIPVSGYANVIREIKGKVWVNNITATSTTVIKPGDTVKTGEDSRIIFVMGEDVYQLNSRSTLRLRGDEENSLVSTMRLLNGTLMSVFSQGERIIKPPTAAIGIRGTGIFIQVNPKGTYFCTCYGTTEITLRGNQRVQSVSSTHHQAYFITHNLDEPQMSTDTLRGHQDQELFYLESLVGRKPPNYFK
jgi:hypothetical protein